MTATSQKSPDISVCIANYNGGGYVLDCLASVYAQLGSFTLEVLLHDDCSSDDSVDLIRREFPSVRILNSDSNVGFCVSNNRMAEAASGRYLLLLNNDAVLRPGSLQHFLDFSVAGNGNQILGLPQYSLIDGSLVDYGYRTDPFLNPVPTLTSASPEVGVATGACLWVPRKVWDAIGGFPAWFDSIAEDIFLCLAARLLGYSVVVLAAPGFDHWIGKNLGGVKLIDQRLNTTVRRRALSERNKTFVILMCYPLPMLFFVLPAHAILLTVEALFLLITGTDRAKVRRIYAPILPALWQHRTQITTLRGHLMRKRQCTFGRLFSQTVWTPQKLSLLMRYGKPELR
jgi:GT2 family glycosyltransferase